MEKKFGRGISALKRSHSRSARARTTVRVRTERGLDRWCHGLGAANFAPFRNSARMKMIWDQRNSTPVIQHFSPKLLGLSYQRQRAWCAVFLAVCVRVSSPRRPRRIQHGVSSWNRSPCGAFYPIAGTEYVWKQSPAYAGKLDFWRAFGRRDSTFATTSLSLSLSLFFYLSVETREYGFSHRGNVGAPLAFSWLRLERISRTFELPHVRAI